MACSIYLTNQSFRSQCFEQTIRSGVVDPMIIFYFLSAYHNRLHIELYCINNDYQTPNDGSMNDYLLMTLILFETGNKYLRIRDKHTLDIRTYESEIAINAWTIIE